MKPCEKISPPSIYWLVVAGASKNGQAGYSMSAQHTREREKKGGKRKGELSSMADTAIAAYLFTFLLLLSLFVII